MSQVFDTLLLLALPASGKSEVRTFLTAKEPAAFHMGDTVQLDDYPYVHLQILVDKALAKLGHAQVFHQTDAGGAQNGPFHDVHELGGLVELLNDDYLALRRGQPDRPADPARRLLERFDAASVRAGGRAKFTSMSADLVTQIADAIREPAREYSDELAASFPKSLDGRTVVIEFARGGPATGHLPLPPGYGYAGSLPRLAPELLSRASVLYIRVDPAESRRKNRERARPDGDGSILFHGTPESVMESEYAACDMMYLVEQSDLPDTLRIERDGRAFHLPVAVFDNRTDLTTFTREPEASWSEANMKALHDGLKGACDRLWAAQGSRAK